MSEPTPEQRLIEMREQVKLKIRVLFRHRKEIEAALTPHLESFSADELEYVFECLCYIDNQALMGTALGADAARSAGMNLEKIEEIKPKLAPERVALIKGLPVFKAYQSL